VAGHKWRSSELRDITLNHHVLGVFVSISFELGIGEHLFTIGLWLPVTATEMDDSSRKEGTK